MKILVVCQYFDPEPFRITDIVYELAKRGHLVDVITGIPNYPEGRFYKGYGLYRRREERSQGVRVLRSAIFPRGGSSKVHLALNYASFAISASVSALFRTNRDYNVILVYQLSPVFMAIPALFAAKKTGAPIVHYVADLWPESLSTAGGTSNRLVNFCVGWIVDKIYRRSRKILVTSPGFIDPIVERGHPSRKLVYLPQYPEDLYKKVTVAEDDPVRAEMPKGFTIIFTGNVGKAQGLNIVVEAAEQLKEYDDIKWVIIGDGRGRAALQEAVDNRGLSNRIIFLGRKPMSRIPIYLALSDAALLCLAPQPLFAITLPAKTQSYLACGIPIIGSIDGDGAKVILESGAGYAGPAGDATALARNVLRLYESSELVRRRHEECALSYFNDNYRKDVLINRLEGILASVSFRH